MFVVFLPGFANVYIYNLFVIIFWGGLLEGKTYCGFQRASDHSIVSVLEELKDLAATSP